MDERIIVVQNLPILIVAKSDSAKLHSKPFGTKAVGIMSIEIPGERIGLHHPLYELGVTINTIEVDPEQQIFTKMVSITPRYVIINTTNKRLAII